MNQEHHSVYNKQFYTDTVEHQKHFLSSTAIPVPYDPRCMDCVYWCCYMTQHPVDFASAYVDDARRFLEQYTSDELNHVIKTVNEGVPGLKHKARMVRASSR